MEDALVHFRNTHCPYLTSFMLCAEHMLRTKHDMDCILVSKVFKEKKGDEMRCTPIQVPPPARCRRDRWRWHNVACNRTRAACLWSVRYFPVRTYFESIFISSVCRSWLALVSGCCFSFVAPWVFVPCFSLFALFTSFLSHRFEKGNRAISMRWRLITSSDRVWYSSWPTLWRKLYSLVSETWNGDHSWDNLAEWMYFKSDWWHCHLP